MERYLSNMFLRFVLLFLQGARRRHRLGDDEPHEDVPEPGGLRAASVRGGARRPRRDGVAAGGIPAGRGHALMDLLFRLSRLHAQHGRIPICAFFFQRVVQGLIGEFLSCGSWCPRNTKYKCEVNMLFFVSPATLDCHSDFFLGCLHVPH